MTSLAKAGKYCKLLAVTFSHLPLFPVGYVIYRTVTKTHIPKKHHDFENPIEGKMFDNTANRIYGEANQQLFNTNNTEYGVAKHSTQGIAQIGRKTARMEREIERQV